MKHTLLAMLVLCIGGPAFASCKPDVGGTFRTNQPELSPFTDIQCAGCREVNAHPQDLRNFMWNWAVLGRGGSLTPGAGSVGKFVFGKRLNAHMVVTPLFGDIPGSNVMIMPISNDHGQAASVELEVIHNVLGLRTERGFTLGLVTGIREINVTVTRANGSQISSTYSVKKMKADLARAGYKMPVPADTKADKAKNGDCLNNAGQKRPPDSQMTPVTGSGSGGDYYYDSWEHWNSWEAAYGGRVPELRCGTISGTGGTWRTCGWFYF